MAFITSEGCSTPAKMFQELQKNITQKKTSCILSYSTVFFEKALSTYGVLYANKTNTL